MRIPKIITRGNRVYIFVKKYPNFILYQNLLGGFNETFTLQEIREGEQKMKICRNCVYFPCAKKDCAIAGQACKEYRGIVEMEIQKIIKEEQQ